MKSTLKSSSRIVIAQALILDSLHVAGEKRSMMHVAFTFLLLALYVAINGIVMAHAATNEWTEQSRAVWENLEAGQRHAYQV